MKRKNILLTGATGNMGFAGLQQLHAHKDNYHLSLLVLPSEKDNKKLKPYKNDKRISIIWGDITNYDDVKRASEKVDIVLHVAALVSPMADSKPKLAWKVNFEGTKNIVDAILAREDRDQVKLMYIGTIAQTGNRAAPYHWGRIGDPILPSVFDYYALSKIAAERYVIESGLKTWVSLRQTGILHPDILKMNDGIGYHQPPNNHLEWVSVHDSGRILRNICEDDIPEDFWGNVYNIGGGETCRLTAYQFTDKIYKMLGVDFRKLEEPNWYATRNFHGQWYYDSDRLNEYLNFRTESVDDVLAQIKKILPLSMRLLKFLPQNWVKRKVMRPQATTPNSPLYWIENNIEDKVKAFIGSKEKWEEIPDWDKFLHIVNPPHQKLDHGYDETKSDQQLSFLEIKQAAKFRGGDCLSDQMDAGDLRSKLNWVCAEGHEFVASPYLVLKAGHWCPKCVGPPWAYDQLAKTNPFIAQLWHQDHDKTENNVYA
ncbi:MAG: NAD-dependent epimerase/dehydratase family protein [Bacteroidia bacterium]